MTTAYLADLANDLLDAAADALIVATTGHDAPGASWVNHGEPAADFCCDAGQVTVHLRDVSHDPGTAFPNWVPAEQACATVPVAGFVVTLLRCHPVPDNNGQPPTPAAQTDAAEALLVDLWALLTELYDRAYACTLFPSQPTLACEDVVIGTAEPASPETEGDCAGWIIPVFVLCNDAGPTGS